MFVTLYICIVFFNCMHKIFLLFQNMKLLNEYKVNINMQTYTFSTDLM